MASHKGEGTTDSSRPRPDAPTTGGLRFWSVWRAFLVLAMVTLVAFVIYVADRGDSRVGWPGDLGLAISTNLAAALLVLAVLDNVIRQREQARRDRITHLALLRLRAPLVDHLYMLVALWKAASRKPPDERGGPLRARMEDIVATAKYLDVTTPWGMDPPDIPWIRGFANHLNALHDATDHVLETHLQYLPTEVAEIILRLLSRFLMEYRLQYSSISAEIAVQAHFNLFWLPGMQAELREYLRALCDLEEVVNEHLEDDERLILDPRLWEPQFSPRIGSARYDHPNRHQYMMYSTTGVPTAERVAEEPGRYEP